MMHEQKKKAQNHQLKLSITTPLVFKQTEMEKRQVVTGRQDLQLQVWREKSLHTVDTPTCYACDVQISYNNIQPLTSHLVHVQTFQQYYQFNYHSVWDGVEQ